MAIFETYVVKSGDTLGRIATDHGTTADSLVALNGLPNRNRISVGQVLNIRRVSEDIHVVQAGETLSGIADAAGIGLDEIVRANGLASADKIAVGQRLLLPSVRAVSVPTKAAPVAGPTAQHELGDLSRKYEVSSGGPGTVSVGTGDHGGVSYGSYQLSSRFGRPAEFLAKEGAPWAAEFNGTEQGTPAFSTIWKAIGKREPAAFHKAQHDFIKRTHFDIQAKKIAKDAKIDVTTRSAAFQDVVWSVAVQHGPGSGVVVDALATLTIAPDSPAFDKEAIQAIYAERGKRNASGDLAFFKSSSKQFQAGVANRFRNELNDALALLTAEGARAKVMPVVAAPAAQPGDKEEEAIDALVQKAAVSLTDDEVRLLLEAFADAEAVGDFLAGRKVAIALRRSTNTRQNILGSYDDTIIVCWREEGGAVRLKRFVGNTEPCGIYAFDGAKAAKGSSTDLNSDGRKDLGRLIPGTYHYVRQAEDFNGAPFFKARDIQVVERDTNQDGDFNEEDGNRIDRSGAQRTMYIHQGGNNMTWSAGCQTIPSKSYGSFLDLVGRQPALSYVLIDAD